MIEKLPYLCKIATSFAGGLICISSDYEYRLLGVTLFLCYMGLTDFGQYEAFPSNHKLIVSTPLHGVAHASGPIIAYCLLLLHKNIPFIKGYYTWIRILGLLQVLSFISLVMVFARGANYFGHDQIEFKTHPVTILLVITSHLFYIWYAWADPELVNDPWCGFTFDGWAKYTPVPKLVYHRWGLVLIIAAYLVHAIIILNFFDATIYSRHKEQISVLDKSITNIDLYLRGMDGQSIDFFTRRTGNISDPWLKEQTRYIAGKITDIEDKIYTANRHNEFYNTSGHDVTVMKTSITNFLTDLTDKVKNQMISADEARSSILQIYNKINVLKNRVIPIDQYTLNRLKIEPAFGVILDICWDLAMGTAFRAYDDSWKPTLTYFIMYHYIRVIPMTRWTLRSLLDSGFEGWIVNLYMEVGLTSDSYSHGIYRTMVDVIRSLTRVGHINRDL